MCIEKPQGRPLPLATTVLPRENSSQGAEAQGSKALSTQTWAPGFTRQCPHKKLCERVWAYNPMPQGSGGGFLELADYPALPASPRSQEGNHVFCLKTQTAWLLGNDT